MQAWIVWLIVAAVLGVAELMTTTFALGIIAVAALVAAAVGALRPRPAVPVARVRGGVRGGPRFRPSRSRGAMSSSPRC